MKFGIGRLLCWLDFHRWEFISGNWVVEKKYALTRRRCARCQLHQEIGQDHMLGMQFLEREWKPK
jgi:hypothetical protein